MKKELFALLAALALVVALFAGMVLDAQRRAKTPCLSAIPLMAMSYRTASVGIG